MDLMMKTGFLSQTKSRDQADLSVDEKIRLLPVDLFALETRFLWVLVFDFSFTKVVKPGFWILGDFRNLVFP
jgi:hypothetical protein